MKKVARYDKGLLPGGEASVTPEGFIRARCIVTRCGVFLYKNSDGSVRRELRHPDDVLQLDSIKSMQMIPIVNGHPKERLVNVENAKNLSIGFTGENVDKEYPFILANLVITDKESVKEVADKKKNELSLGYTVDLEPEKGLYYGEPYDYRQTNIRYNHLALVDMARAGPEARIALDSGDAINVSEYEMAEKKKVLIKIDAQEYMVEGDIAEHISKLQSHHKRLEDELMSSKEALAKAEAQRDAMKDSYTEKLENSKEGVEFPGKMEGQGEEHTHHKMMKGMEKDNMPMKMREKDEIGSNGKEMKDMSGRSGPTQMRNNPVNGPKGNEHYPNDLPHFNKVDEADVRKMANARVKLIAQAQRYMPRSQLSRIDDMDDLAIQTAILKIKIPQTNFDGKSAEYIKARFDMMTEENPEPKAPESSKYSDNRPNVDSADSRDKMKRRLENAWKGA